VKTHILNSLNQSQDMLMAFLLNADNITNIENGAHLLIEALKRHGSIFSCGNGGSMSDAMHFAEEYPVDTVKVEVVYQQRQLVIQGILRVSLMTLVMNIFSHDI
jgi:hypothetical protein